MAEIVVADSTTGYINAGGRGTRLNSLFSPHPDYGVAKALLEIGNPPVKLVDYQISRMLPVNLRNIIIGAGDVAPVKQYIDSIYRAESGVMAVAAAEQFGTAGDLLVALDGQPAQFGDRVLVKNVDTILDIDDSAFLVSHVQSGEPVSIALTTLPDVPNAGAYGVDIDTGKVRECVEAGYHATADQGLPLQRLSSTGAVIIETDFLKELHWAPGEGQLSLYRQVIGIALASRAVNAYNNGSNFFKDIGTVKEWLDVKDGGGSARAIEEFGYRK